MCTQDYMTLGVRSSLMDLTIQMMYEISLKPSKNSTAQMGLAQRIWLSRNDLKRSSLQQCLHKSHWLKAKMLSTYPSQQLAMLPSSLF